MDDFFRFSKKIGFGVFLFHPTVLSVLLSASVERCFVSRMRDFSNYIMLNTDISPLNIKMGLVMRLNFYQTGLVEPYKALSGWGAGMVT